MVKVGGKYSQLSPQDIGLGNKGKWESTLVEKFLAENNFDL